jgi:hypothetical protein
MFIMIACRGSHGSRRRFAAPHHEDVSVLILSRRASAVSKDEATGPENTSVDYANNGRPPNMGCRHSRAISPRTQAGQLPEDIARSDARAQSTLMPPALIGTAHLAISLCTNVARYSGVVRSSETNLRPALSSFRAH